MSRFIKMTAAAGILYVVACLSYQMGVRYEQIQHEED